MKIIGLIPVRLSSKRLKHKALLKIKNLPMIVHTYRRAKMSRLLDDVIVCIESKKIEKELKRFNVKYIFTSKKHINGTERIAEAAKKIKADIFIDIQGDEPLIDPKNIDSLIKFHKKNKRFDIVVPYLKIPNSNNENIVKIVKDKKNKILYFSRLSIPYSFHSKPKNIFKHLSIISFRRKSLINFSNLKQSYLEKIEGIELMRAIENSINVGTFEAKGKSIAVDKLEDYENAIVKIENDPLTKKYL